MYMFNIISVLIVRFSFKASKLCCKRKVTNWPDHWSSAPLYCRRGSHWKQLSKSLFPTKQTSGRQNMNLGSNDCWRGIFTWPAKTWQRRGSVRERDQEVQSLTRQRDPLRTESESRRFNKMKAKVKVNDSKIKMYNLQHNSEVHCWLKV